MGAVDQQRFGGVARLYGVEALAHFARSRVAVAGIGGVGSWAAEALVRSGLGRLLLIDLDDLCLTNVNRQIHALEPSLGASKVAVMAARLRLVNPALDCEEVEALVEPDNLDRLLPADLDAVIDATDDVPAKAALIAYCRRRRLPVVTLGGAGGQLDPTQIRVADLSRTTQDPLAAKVRQRLRREYGFSRNPKRRFEVPCVYSLEPLKYPTPEGGVSLARPAQDFAATDCDSGFGTSVCVTATFGMVAAARCLERLAGSRGQA